MAKITIVIEDSDAGDVDTSFESVPPIDLSDESELTLAQTIGAQIMEFAVRQAQMTAGKVVRIHKPN